MGRETRAEKTLTAAGPGTVALLPELIERLAGPSARIVVVVSGGFSQRKWRNSILAGLRPLTWSLFIHRGETTPASVAALARYLHTAEADAVVAVGGGTVLDVAKAASGFASVCDVDEGQIVTACDAAVPSSSSLPALPVIAVPSTAGTGAEVTPNATIWDRTRGRKLSVRGPAVLPAGVVLDPDLLIGLPGTHLVSGALDSLCQGVEAAWSVRSSPGSISRGLAAISLAADALARLPRVPVATLPVPSLVDRLAFQQAGHLSGLAIAETPTSSCHAISYPLTLRHRIPHGIACGMSAARLMRYNAAVDGATVADCRGVGHVRKVLAEIAAAMNMVSAEAASQWVDSIFSRFGLPRLSDLPISPRDLAAEALSYGRCHDNPRQVDLERLTVLLSPQTHCDYAA
jgi:alcohol dehydrogenase class IV